MKCKETFRFGKQCLPTLLILAVCRSPSPFRVHRPSDVANPSSMQDRCLHESSKYDLTSHESPSNSVVRASDKSGEGRGSNSLQGLRDLKNSILLITVMLRLTCDRLSLLLFYFRWKLSSGRFVHLPSNRQEDAMLSFTAEHK